MTDEQLQKIARVVEAEFGMGGLSDGLYFEFAAEVAKRAINCATKQSSYDEVGNPIMVKA